MAGKYDRKVAAIEAKNHIEDSIDDLMKKYDRDGGFEDFWVLDTLDGILRDLNKISIYISNS